MVALDDVPTYDEHTTNSLAADSVVIKYTVASNPTSSLIAN